MDGGAVSRDGSVSLDWADDTHRFRLAWGQLIELQDATEAGPAVVLKRLMDGTWRLQDVSHTLRLGLIGGGMEPVKALKMVRQYVEARPPMESLVYAQAVLSVALLGSAEDEPKKNDAETPSTSTTSPTAASDMPPSSAPGLQ